jgi:hypothetical protein
MTEADQERDDKAVETELAAVVDNDVLKKVLCYRLAALIWPEHDGRIPVGILGAARYVLADAIRRVTLNGDKDAALTALAAFVDSAVELEPSEREIELAASLEEAAQRASLELDTGESQLAAIAVERYIAELHTGDKRAIAALGQTLDDVSALGRLAGRVHCLEQLFVRLLDAADDEATIIARVCDEPNVDKSLSISFSCYSGGGDSATAREGLASYIEAVRRTAPQILAA